MAAPVRVQSVGSDSGGHSRWQIVTNSIHGNGQRTRWSEFPEQQSRSHIDKWCGFTINTIIGRYLGNIGGIQEEWGIEGEYNYMFISQQILPAPKGNAAKVWFELPRRGIQHVDDHPIRLAQGILQILISPYLPRGCPKGNQWNRISSARVILAASLEPYRRRLHSARHLEPFIGSSVHVLHWRTVRRVG